MTTDAIARIRPTTLAGRLLTELVKEATPPPTMPGTLEEWKGMSEAERLDMLEWFVGELQENTEGIGVQFPRIKYPTSGTSFWQVDTGESELMPVSALAGVILKKAECRVFYKPTADDSITEGAIPDCFSGDLITPDPEAQNKQSETCATCRQSKWGSGKGAVDGKGGAGQACKTRVRVYMALRSLMPGKGGRMECTGPLEQVPTFLSIPPTGKTPMSIYVTTLSNQTKALSAVTTRFGLSPKKNKAGQEYSALDPSSVGIIDRAEARMIKGMKEVYGEMMKYRSGKDFLADIAADSQQGIQGADPGMDFPGTDPDLDGKDGYKEEIL
jgi:hypothetical protein